MRPKDCIGLYLAWSQTYDSLILLQLFFGITFTDVAKCIQSACRIVIKNIKLDPIAKTVMPSHDKHEK